MRNRASANVLLDPASEPFAVDSAFGGLGIYRLQDIRGCRYGLWGCEHWDFHSCLRARGKTVLVHPAMAIEWADRGHGPIYQSCKRSWVDRNGLRQKPPSWTNVATQGLAAYATATQIPSRSVKTSQRSTARTNRHKEGKAPAALGGTAGAPGAPLLVVWPTGEMSDPSRDPGEPPPPPPWSLRSFALCWFSAFVAGGITKGKDSKC